MTATKLINNPLAEGEIYKNKKTLSNCEKKQN